MIRLRSQRHHQLGHPYCLNRSLRTATSRIEADPGGTGQLGYKARLNEVAELYPVSVGKIPGMSARIYPASRAC